MVDKVNDTVTIKEFKADGEDSSVPDPTTSKVKSRKADKNMSGEKAEKVPHEEKSGGPKKQLRPADNKTMGEHVDDIFEGEELSEEVRDRAAVAFELAVNERVEGLREEIESEFDAKYESFTESTVSDLTDKLNGYLDYVAESWLEENRVAVEQGLRAEMTESLISGMRKLFAENSIEVDDSEIDIVAEQADKINDLTEALIEYRAENKRLEESLLEAACEDVLEGISEGMTDTQKDKLNSLVEGIEYDTVDEFERKARIISEKVFGGKKTEKTTDLNESVGDDNIDPIDSDDDNTKQIPAEMRRYVENLNRL